MLTSFFILGVMYLAFIVVMALVHIGKSLGD